MAIAYSSTATIFANQRCITSWSIEAKRVAKKFTRSSAQQHAASVQNAIVLLGDLYCANNPQQKNPLQVRQAIFTSFLEASLAGYPLAMFFEGLARLEGFGCAQDRATGQALIHVAGARKCAEALNYLAVSCFRQDLITSLSLFRMAAYDGHAQALVNFRQLAENIRIQILRKRKIVELAAHPHRSRLTF